LGADIYFAHLYSSWERGLNESINCLIWQNFPTGRRFEDITDKQHTVFFAEVERKATHDS